MMCIFVENWDCNFAGQEITLDICKTCIDAKRLYHETKHDKALQERKKRMEKEVKEQKPEPGIVPEREKPKERPKEKPKERPKPETKTKTPEIEGKSPLEAIEEEIYSDKVEEKGLIEEKGFIESLAEEGPEEKIEEESSKERLEPASIIEMENLQGSVDDIQSDPTRPTDSWLTTAGEGEYSLLKADFPNPPDKLQIGEDEQEFLVRVRRTEDEFFFPPYPEVNVKICENGDVVTETGRKEIEDIHGEVVSLKWNAGELLDLYGPDVEIVVEGFGIGDEGTHNRIEIGAVEWRANLVESTAKAQRSDEQNLEEKLLSPLKEESEDETIETIRSDLNPMG